MPGDFLRGAGERQDRLRDAALQNAPDYKRDDDARGENSERRRDIGPHVRIPRPQIPVDEQRAITAAARGDGVEDLQPAVLGGDPTRSRRGRQRARPSRRAIGRERLAVLIEDHRVAHGGFAAQRVQDPPGIVGVEKRERRRAVFRDRRRERAEALFIVFQGRALVQRDEDRAASATAVEVGITIADRRCRSETCSGISRCRRGEAWRAG